MRTIRILLIMLFAALFARPAAAQGLIFRDSVQSVNGISEDDAPRVYRFRYENTSTQPVVILRVETTCGCAQPSFTRQPILSGATGEVSVTFYPLGRPGALYKLLTVFTNRSGSRPAARLVLSGTVKQTADKYISYPHHMGALRLRRADVNFRAVTAPNKRKERIEVANGGKRPMQLKAFGLPPYIEFSSEPAVIAPDSVADLVFTLRSDKTDLRGPFDVEIFLDNLGEPVAPSKRAIRIKGEIK